MEITKLIDLVFQAVHAVLVDRMQAGLKRSNKYLSDLLVSHDKNKDGFLDYGEFESMLLEIQISFKPQIMQKTLIREIMDVGGRNAKISFDIVKHVIGDNIGGGMDITPSLEEPSSGGSGAFSANQLKSIKAAARKVLIAFNGQMMDVLSREDTHNVGMLKMEKVKSKINEKPIKDLKPSELTLLMNYCDPGSYGFIVIPNFCTKLNDLAQETKDEVLLKQFSINVGR